LLLLAESRVTVSGRRTETALGQNRIFGRLAGVPQRGASNKARRDGTNLTSWLFERRGLQSPLSRLKMVDVTVDNFEDALRRLRTLVPQCDFVAIDLEFTGLDHDAFGATEAAGGGAADAAELAAGASGAAGPRPSAPTGAAAEQPAPFDLRKEAQAKYAKLRDATEFMVVQVGVCPFVFKQKSQTWLASPFNFYVFPCEFRGIDRRFMCQTRCMQFLANNSLDFNKLFKSGVPFLNHQEVKTAEREKERERERGGGGWAGRGGGGERYRELRAPKKGPHNSASRGRLPLCARMLMHACARAHDAHRRSSSARAAARIRRSLRARARPSSISSAMLRSNPWCFRPPTVSTACSSTVN
jgi:hypothetical protein